MPPALPSQGRPFVQLLGDDHRFSGSEIELSRRFLLQRGGDKGQHGLRLRSLRFDTFDDKSVFLLDVNNASYYRLPFQFRFSHLYTVKLRFHFASPLPKWPYDQYSSG